MFIDLNVPVPVPGSRQTPGPAQSKKAKGKQPGAPQSIQASFSPVQIIAIESRIDLLIHLGYTIFAFNQTVERKVDPKVHFNAVDALLGQLRKRDGIVYLKRVTIVLDEESEKGFGLTNSNAGIFAGYDFIALAPTTATSFSLACLTHTLPSPLTAHIISLPLTLPRLPFNLKHTLVRNALKNGAVFELNYVGALGGEGDTGGGEAGTGAKRNWWAAAREVVRVTKGKGILVSGGVTNSGDLRAPRDIANLITVLGLPQDVAHDASTRVPQSLILRAQTRRTYRAVLSEPKVVIPGQITASTDQTSIPSLHPLPQQAVKANQPIPDHTPTPTPDVATPAPMSAAADVPKSSGKKRPLEETPERDTGRTAPESAADGNKAGPSRKKKKHKAKESKAA
ncbi:PHP domain-like protein [Obba rivulosa]|uniref:PHP domain-like protein n=1 Tax=Obba rivulosa TaxID=1052685 RepID=A0A8E2AVJ7_9APHY|nr:PHP domain-like protein [Obba rivulosa]